MFFNGVIQAEALKYMPYIMSHMKLSKYFQPNALLDAIRAIASVDFNRLPKFYDYCMKHNEFKSILSNNKYKHQLCIKLTYVMSNDSSQDLEHKFGLLPHLEIDPTMSLFLASLRFMSEFKENNMHQALVWANHCVLNTRLPYEMDWGYIPPLFWCLAISHHESTSLAFNYLQDFMSKNNTTAPAQNILKFIKSQRRDKKLSLDIKKALNDMEKRLIAMVK
jgi:hypothetical protein